MIDVRDDELLELTTRAYWWKPMAAWFNALQLRTLCSCDVILSGRVLDLGCGDGGLARLLGGLRLLTGRAFGVDIAAVELAKARSSSPHAALLQADGGRLPFPDNAFSSVVCSGVLGSAPGGPDRILTEIHRVLEPGGILLATIPTDMFSAVLLWPTLLGRLSPTLSREYVRRLTRRLPHVSVHSVDGWRALVAAHDMEVVDVRPFFGPSEGRLWSVLALQAVRAIALIKLSHIRVAERAMQRIVKNALARFFELAPVARGDAGYVAIAARRPSGRRETGQPAPFTPLSSA